MGNSAVAPSIVTLQKPCSPVLYHVKHMYELDQSLCTVQSNVLLGELFKMKHCELKVPAKFPVKLSCMPSGHCSVHTLVQKAIDTFWHATDTPDKCQ